MKTPGRLIKNTSYYSIGAIFQYGLAFFLLPLYTNYLTLVDYGLIATFSVLASISTNILSTPYITSLIRFYRSPEYTENQSILCISAFLPLLILSVLFVLVVVGLQSFIVIGFFKQNESLFIIYVCIVFFTSISDYQKALIRIDEKPIAFITNSILYFAVSNAISIFLIVYNDYKAEGLAIGYLCGAIFSALFLSPVLIRKTEMNFSFNIFKKVAAYGYPLIIGNLANLIIQSSDRLVIKKLIDDKAVGFYSFGYQFAGIFRGFIIQPLNNALMPILLSMENRPDYLREFVRKLATIYFAGAAFVTLLISFFSEEVIFLLASNEDFHPSYKIVFIITFSLSLHGLLTFTTIGLLLSKKSNIISYTTVVAALVNIILNFILIPVLSVYGAAISTLISYVLWNIVRYHYSKKHWKIIINGKVIFKIAIITFICYTPIMYIETGLIIKLIIKLSLLLLFIALMYLTTPILEKPEIALAKSYLNKIIKKGKRKNEQD